MKRQSIRIFGLVMVLAATALVSSSCADDPPGDENAGLELLPYEEEEIDETWNDDSDEPSLYKNLSTVQELINARGCSTGPTAGLNAQIAEEINCKRPGMFVSISDIPNVRLGSGASPFVQGSAAAGLRSAAATSPQSVFNINSSWRSLVQQYILKSWEGSCGIRIAATPGRSRHESGLALDVPSSTTSRFRSAMRSNGWTWYCDRTNGGRSSGCGDPPHWDFFDGTDLRSHSVRAFQRLWNHANPNDRISEDGLYGNQTASRIRQAPLGGFSSGTTCGATNNPDPVEPNNPIEPNEPIEEPGAQETRTIAGLANDARGRSTGTQASIWRTRLTSQSCGSAQISENFSTGRFNVHRWSTQIEPTGPMRIQYSSTAGDWKPALFVFDPAGQLIVAGDAAGGHSQAEATIINSGRSGSVAEVEIETSRSMAVYVYVTSWAASDSGLTTRIPRSARYGLSMNQTCGGDAPSGGLAGLHSGLTRDGMEIPRAGVRNGTLNSVHGVSTETHGTQTTFEGLSFVKGTISWFGGPNDTGVTSTETGTITGERLRSLNSPTNPSSSTLSSRPEDYYFIAMRWNYSPAGKSWWRNARLLVVNPDTGAAIVVRVVDWGPNIRTGRVMDLSPQALRDLGLVTDKNALVSFASPNAPLGPVE